MISLEDGKNLAPGALPRQSTAPIAATPTPASTSTKTAPVPEPSPTPAHIAMPAPERKLPEPTRVVEPVVRPASPIKVVRPASPVKAVKQNGTSPSLAPSTSTPTPHSNSNEKDGGGALTSLQDEIELLKEEMAKRDNLIRKLELENERLRANERRVREVMGGSAV